jgi:hypothetical protein
MNEAVFYWICSSNDRIDCCGGGVECSRVVWDSRGAIVRSCKAGATRAGDLAKECVVEVEQLQADSEWMSCAPGYKTWAVGVCLAEEADLTVARAER